MKYQCTVTYSVTVELNDIEVATPIAGGDLAVKLMETPLTELMQTPEYKGMTSKAECINVKVTVAPRQEATRPVYEFHQTG